MNTLITFIREPNYMFFVCVYFVTVRDGWKGVDITQIMLTTCYAHNSKTYPNNDDLVLVVLVCSISDLPPKVMFNIYR